MTGWRWSLSMNAESLVEFGFGLILEMMEQNAEKCLSFSDLAKKIAMLNA